MIIIDDDGIMHKVLPIDTLDKIRTELEQMDFDFGDFYDHTSTIREIVLKVIDKHMAESEEE